MKNIKPLLLILMISVLFFMSACQNNTGEGNASLEPITSPETSPGGNEISYPLTIKDSRGEEITIEREPMRLVSMAPNITEIIFALGKGNSLVGRTDYCNYPQEVLERTSIGNIYMPDLEKIVALQPDLVLISGTTMPDSLSSLADVGIKFMVISEQNSFDGVYETIRLIGKVLNAVPEAEKIIDAMKAKVTAVTEKVKDLPKPKTYYVMSYGQYGEYTATGDTFLGKMIEMAGGDNIARDASGWKYNLEDIVAKDPEILLVSPMYGMITDPVDVLSKEAGYKDLTAVKKGRCVLVDDDLINRQGPRLAEGLEHLARAIHPEVFENE